MIQTGKIYAFYMFLSLHPVRTHLHLYNLNMVKYVSLQLVLVPCGGRKMSPYFTIVNSTVYIYFWSFVISEPIPGFFLKIYMRVTD